MKLHEIEAALRALQQRIEPGTIEVVTTDADDCVVVHARGFAPPREEQHVLPMPTDRPDWWPEDLADALNGALALGAHERAIWIP